MNNYGELAQPTSAYQSDELSSYRPINIEPLNVGFILRVGCQSIAVENKDDLVKYLNKYFENPVQTEKDYYSRELFKKEVTK